MEQKGYNKLMRKLREFRENLRNNKEDAKAFVDRLGLGDAKAMSMRQLRNYDIYTVQGYETRGEGWTEIYFDEDNGQEIEAFSIEEALAEALFIEHTFEGAAEDTVRDLCEGGSMSGEFFCEGRVYQIELVPTVTVIDISVERGVLREEF